MVEAAAPGLGSERYLHALVVTAGACTLGLEMASLSLLAPYFGVSQLVWASIIGLTLLFLAIGYGLGGRIADGAPRMDVLSAILLLAGVFVTVIPIASRSVLLWTLNRFPSLLFIGSLLAMTVLFSIPMTLLAMTGPFATRLALRSMQAAGRTAGSLYALSTVGSLLGTFLPTLLLTPLIGTSRTIHLFAIVLLTVSFPGLWAQRRPLLMLSVAGLSVAGWCFMHSDGRIKSVRGDVYQGESFFNYIQVSKGRATDGSDTYLLSLNDGRGVHSLYSNKYEQTHDPDDLLVHAYWDLPSIAPFLYPHRDPSSIHSLAMIGLGGGTIPKQFLTFYGSDAIVDGVELDSRIVEVGRTFFALDDGSSQHPNFHIYAQDGRAFLNTTQNSYDVVAIDCYRQYVVPFHLVTRECFQTIRHRLNPDGVVVIKCDRGPVGHAIAATLKSVFPQVFQMNALAIAVNRPVGDGVANMKENGARLENATLRHIIEEIPGLTTGEFAFEEWRDQGEVLTDDRAPVEYLLHLDQVERAARKLGLR